MERVVKLASAMKRRRKLAEFKKAAATKVAAE